jgi:predicted MFS family arabinose efflux permease
MNDRTFRSQPKQYRRAEAGRTMLVMTADAARADGAAPADVASGQRATYGAVFAVREFRVLFTGMLLFVLGFEFEILGMSVLVYARSGSGLLTAVTFSAGFLPQALSGIFLTSLADRLPPRLVIAASLLARALPGLAIGLVPGMPISVMLAVIAAAALITPVFLASGSGLLPEILEGDAYTLGRSVLGLVSAGTQILGLGLGGVLLAAMSARWLMLSAGILLAGAAVVTRLGLRAHPARAVAGIKAGTGLRGVVRATLAGNRELVSSRQIRRLLAAQWLPAWFMTGGEALTVPFTESAGHPASAASLLLAATPCGMLLGNFAVGRFCAPESRERLVLPLSLLTGAPLLVFALRPSLAVGAVALFVCGTGFAYTLGIQRPFRDAVPERLRGQGFGLASTGLMGGQGLTPTVFGGVSGGVGAGGAMAAAGACVVLGALLVSRRRLLSDRTP